MVKEKKKKPYLSVSQKMMVGPQTEVEIRGQKSSKYWNGAKQESGKNNQQFLLVKLSHPELTVNGGLVMR